MGEHISGQVPSHGSLAILRTSLQKLATTPAGLVMLTIIVSGGIRIVLAWAVGYGFGEGYYLATARHFALSYFDQPPLSLWIAWAVIKLVGTDPVFVRLPFILIFAATTFAMYRLGAMLFGERAGAWSAILLNLSPEFTVSVASWLQPDGPLMLFILLATLAVAHLIFEAPRRPLLTWAAAGAAFGLAFLSKYHAALVLGGLIIFVVTTRGYRTWFFRPGLLLATLVSLLIISPVLIWNSQNQWVSFFFQGDRIVESASLRIDWLLRNIGGQALIMGVLIWPPLIIVFVRGLLAGSRDVRTWFLCCLAIIPIILFTIASLWAPLGWHFHWQAPGYLFLFPLLGKVVAEQLDAGLAGTKRWIASAAGLLFIMVAVVSTQALTGWMRYVFPPAIAAKLGAPANPTRELLQWHGLKEALVRNGMIGRPRIFAVAPQWHQVGKVDVQIGDEMPVVCLCSDPRNIAFSWDTRQFAGWDALIIGTDDYLRDVHATYGNYFRGIEPLDELNVFLGDQVDLTVHIYLAHDYYKAFPMTLPPGR